MGTYMICTKYVKTVHFARITDSFQIPSVVPVPLANEVIDQRDSSAKKLATSHDVFLSEGKIYSWLSSSEYEELSTSTQDDVLSEWLSSLQTVFPGPLEG